MDYQIYARLSERHMNIQTGTGTMKNQKLKAVAACIAFHFVLLLGLKNSYPAEISQAITLNPGWNAIFLEVEPNSTDPGDVFSLITDLQSVWQWNNRAGTVEFIQNPDLLVPEEPQMLVYIPGNEVVTNLHAINGNKAYLVQVGGSGDQVLTVSGEPLVPYHDWKPNSFNFVGFHLAGSAEPNFGDFFVSSPAHADQDIYLLNNLSGAWERVTDPFLEDMERGEAFWIYCSGSSTFNGPVSVQLEQSTGLHFGKISSQQDIMVKNDSADLRTVSFAFPELLAGVQVVHYWVYDEAASAPSWEPVPAALDADIPAGESQRLRIGVKRVGLTADTSYQTNLAVDDNQGYTFDIPLSVTGISYNGLWTGYATINRVSDQNKVSGQTQDTTELPTGSEFDFRLIIHADTGGTVRLLSEVVQMWQPSTWKPDPNDPGKQIIDQPGEAVLLADDSLIGDYTGYTLRDGQPVGRRISAPVFPRIAAADLPFDDADAAAGGTFIPTPDAYLEELITLAPEDPTNPFRHLFHPAHRNDEEAAHQYEISRTIRLTFAEEDDDGNPITGLPSLNWGSSEIGGVYTETITGLHDRPIYIKGTFVLHRVSDVDTLTLP